MMLHGAAWALGGLAVMITYSVDGWLMWVLLVACWLALFPVIIRDERMVRRDLREARFLAWQRGWLDQLNDAELDDDNPYREDHR